jgi:hypothetical protein
MFHSKSTLPLARRLILESRRLRTAASSAPLGEARQRLISRAQQMEAAFEVNGWITSPGLQAPT